MWMMIKECFEKKILQCSSSYRFFINEREFAPSRSSFSNSSDRFFYLLPLFILILFSEITFGQVCNPAGNVVIFSNYEGGTLNIDIDENLANLKIGICTYEAVEVNITGPFAGNVTEVIFAGFNGTGSCTGVPTTVVNGVDPSIVTLYTTNNPAITPYLGDDSFGGIPLVNCMTSGSGCVESTDQGGNSANQIVQFFLFEFQAPAVFRSHFSQYECFNNENFALSGGGNCCLSEPNTPPNPIYTPGATYNLIEETTFSLCDGPVSVNILYQVLFQPPIYPGYVWSNGATGPDVTFNTPGVYTVSTNDYCHYGSNATLFDEITVLECTNEIVVLPEVVPACPGGSGQIILDITGGTPPYSFDWVPNIGIMSGNTYFFVINEDTDLFLTVTDAAGISTTLSAAATVLNELSDVNLGPDQDLCDNPNIVLNATTPGALSYDWSTGQTTPSITISAPGTYSVVVTGTCNEVQDAVVISPCFVPLEVSLGESQIVCAGETALIQAFATGGQPPYNYSWIPTLSNSPGPFSVTINETTNYTVIVQDTDGNSATTQLLVLVPTSDVVVELGPDTIICIGDVISLDAFHPDAISYSWNNGSTSEGIQVTSSGSYSVIVAGACSFASDTIAVTSLSQTLPTFPRSVRYCEGKPTLIGPLVNDGFQVFWSSGQTESPLEILLPGLYTATIISPCGSSSISVNAVEVDCSCDVFMPNAFTPGVDGFNDLFKPVINCDVEEYEMEIFNRLGELIFETNDPELGWNGASNESSSYFGGIQVYAWRLSVRQNDEFFVTSPFQLQGHVTLIR